MQSPTTNRRAILSAAAWSVPVVAVATAAPAFAASRPARGAGAEYGLFVSTSSQAGYVGYTTGTLTSTGNPTTPEAYFASNPRPEADFGWRDSGSCATAGTNTYSNGEGSFTPVTNGPSGSPGSYAPSSGFWWSVPTESAETGTGYIPKSSATLKSGATFTTNIAIDVPAGNMSDWTLNNIKVAGKNWTGPLSGKLTRSAGTATNLAVGQIPGSWTLSAPTIVTNADGSKTLTGTLVFKTTSDATVTQSGTKYYGQAIIMPATLQMNPSYGWTSVSFTSEVSNATIAYTGQPASMAPSTTLTNAELTTSTLVNRGC